ncbi:hypothetical protein [Enterobacter sp. 148H3]|uniref:hypothetical protein n=1 Tax=Enterobacter sp. 148H3 TaxID=3077756 RepID=UPI0011BF7FF1|nr:hypothetical protein [Enterobacter sp. 148H3]
MKQVKIIGKVLLVAAALSGTSAWAATTMNGSSSNTIAVSFFAPATVKITGSAFPLTSGNNGTGVKIAQITVDPNGVTGNAAIKFTSQSAGTTTTTGPLNSTTGLGTIEISCGTANAYNPGTTCSTAPAADIYAHSNTSNSPYTFLITKAGNTNIPAGTYNIDVTAGVWN